MSFKKTICAKHPDNSTTEYEGKILQEIYHKYRGTDTDLFLVKYSDNGVGWVYEGQAHIGNCKSLLGNEDYWQAYDKLF